MRGHTGSRTRVIALAIVCAAAGSAQLNLRLRAQPAGVHRFANRSADTATVPEEWQADPVTLTAPSRLRCRWSTTRNGNLVRRCRDVGGDDSTTLYTQPEIEQLLDGGGRDPGADETFRRVERALACLVTFAGRAWRSPEGADEVGAWLMDDGQELALYRGTEKELHLGSPPEGAVASAHTHSASINSGAGPGDANAAAISGRLVYIVSPQGVRAITPATAGYWHYMMHAKHHHRAGQSISTRHWKRHFGAQPCDGIRVIQAGRPGDASEEGQVAPVR